MKRLLWVTLAVSIASWLSTKYYTCIFESSRHIWKCIHSTQDSAAIDFKKVQILVLVLKSIMGCIQIRKSAVVHNLLRCVNVMLYLIMWQVGHAHLFDWCFIRKNMQLIKWEPTKETGHYPLEPQNCGLGTFSHKTIEEASTT